MLFRSTLGESAILYAEVWSFEVGQVGQVWKALVYSVLFGVYTSSQVGQRLDRVRRHRFTLHSLGAFFYLYSELLIRWSMTGKFVPHQLAVQPHPDLPGVRVVGIRCLDGSTRALGCGESDREVIDACLGYEGGLWAEDIAELLGIDRAEAWAHLQALRVQGRCHRRGGGSQWMRGKAAPWGKAAGNA